MSSERGASLAQRSASTPCSRKMRRKRGVASGSVSSARPARAAPPDTPPGCPRGASRPCGQDPATIRRAAAARGGASCATPCSSRRRRPASPPTPPTARRAPPQRSALPSPAGARPRPRPSPKALPSERASRGQRRPLLGSASPRIRGDPAGTRLGYHRLHLPRPQQTLRPEKNAGPRPLAPPTRPHETKTVGRRGANREADLRLHWYSNQRSLGPWPARRKRARRQCRRVCLSLKDKLDA